MAKSGHQDAGPPRRLICAFPVCGIRAPFRWPRLPAGDEAGICVLGLREPGSLALPNLLAVVGMGAALSTSFHSGVTSGEFHLTQFGFKQSGASPSVVFALAQKMPNQDRQLSCRGDGCHRLAAAGACVFRSIVNGHSGGL